MKYTVEEDLQIKTSSTIEDEKQLIICIQSEAFINLVRQQKMEYENILSSCAEGQQTLNNYCAKMRRCFPGKNLTLVVMGLEKYFRGIKNAQARQYREKVLANSSNDDSSKGKGRKRKGGDMVVSRIDVEEELVSLQMFDNTVVRKCESEEEFNELVVMFTTSIAEAPYRKSQPSALKFCVEGVGKNSVKVLAKGQGLLDVWRAQLMQFRNVSQPAASAIVSAYPSPQLLLQAYEGCSSKEEAELLLENIQVRRGVGVLASSRRIGPVLSKRVYSLFTTTDADTIMSDQGSNLEQ